MISGPTQVGRPVYGDGLTRPASRPDARDESASAQPQFNVVCVCGGYGFPFGTASGARIAAVGKTLLAGGVNFRLIHCGPSPVIINDQQTGLHEGISFEYTTSTKRPASRIARWVTYGWGVLGLMARLFRLRKERDRTVIYLYVIDGLLNLVVGATCRALDLAVVQELCEWPSGEPTCGGFTKWLYSGPIFKLATGALVISKEIESRTRLQGSALNRDLLVYRLPSIVDPAKFTGPSLTGECDETPVPTFVYCGTWLRDVSFMIEALVEVLRHGYNCRLKLIGGWTEEDKRSILEVVSSLNVPHDAVELPGCVDEDTLNTSYRSAAALLMPLWADDRSVTRLPNKMGEYLASGRPIITSAVGDLTEFLSDGVNAYVSEPGNRTAFCASMMTVLDHSDQANRVGAAGREAGRHYLDYRHYVTDLTNFFTYCLHWRQELRLRKMQRRLSVRLRNAARNQVCRLISLVLIASGAQGRGLKRAFQPGVVTAVYFHKPNRRLFERCMRWLNGRGFTFLSDKQFADVLHGKLSAPAGSVWVSFDDGCKELLTDVIPVIREHHIPITLFIPAGIIEGNGLFPWVEHASFPHDGSAYFIDPHTGRDALTLTALQSLASLPEVSIGSHSVTHAYLHLLSEDSLTYELEVSKRRLEGLLSVPVRGFAYPGGCFTGTESLSLSLAGYQFAATIQNALIASPIALYYIPRFSVADNISCEEAICNMSGAWRPISAFAHTVLQRRPLTSFGARFLP